MNNKPSKTLTKFLPVLEWLPFYKKEDLPGDVSAGLTVGIMLIPQGMAYAMLAGLEPIHGLYAVTIPLLLYTILGTSRQLAVGPDAIISLLTAAGIAALKTSTPEEYLLYALTLTLMVGLIRLGMGLFRLGFVVNFLSRPVINGFTSAAAIIIALSQVKHWFRIEMAQTGQVQDSIVAIAGNFAQVHWLSFWVGILGMAIIIFGKKIHRFFPSQLAAVVIGIVLARVLSLDESGVYIVGMVPGGFPHLSFPSTELALWKDLFPFALTIALVGYAQSIAIAKSLQAKHRNYIINANQELIALGAVNLGAAFFNGLPVAGGFSRSAVNDTAGANTQLSSMISAALVLITLAFFTQLFYYLPLPVLAAVILVAVSNLFNIKEPVELWKLDKSDFSMWSATFIITIIFGIELGILAGMGLSLLMVIYKASRPHMAQLGKVPGTAVYRNIRRFDDLETREGLVIVRLDGPIYFANVDYIKEKLDKWMHQREGKAQSLIFNMESVISLDSTGAHALTEWIRGWREQGIDLYITGAKGPVRDALNRWGLIESVGKNHIFLDDHTAVEYIGHRVHEERLREHSSYATQFNTGKKR